jgi:bifunctional DNase/RNase
MRACYAFFEGSLRERSIISEGGSMKHSVRLFLLTGAVFVARPVLAADPPAKPQTQERSRTQMVPDGFVEMFVWDVLPTRGGPAVVLRDKAEKTLVPIWIGTSEAHSIKLRQERRRFPRPLTHDLLDAIMHELGGEIVKIHVDDLKGDTFVGTVFVKKGEHVQHFDARPSDAIALAVGNSAPIFVSKAVIERVNADRKDTEKDAAVKGEAPADDESQTPSTDAPPQAVQTL